MESRNLKILCSTGKTHEQGFETQKCNPETGKFFVQPEKDMNRDLKPENGIPKPEFFFVQPEKPMNRDLKPENGYHNRKRTIRNQQKVFIKSETCNLNRKRT